MEVSIFLSVSAFTVSCILLFHGNTEAAVDVSINCGSKWNSTALDGREWTGESASASISGQSTSSAIVAASFLGADHVPYMTSRISSSPFHFTFQVNPGQKFIRLHFYPALYRGFEKSLDLFTVKSGPFILLSHFSPTHASGSDQLGVKYIVKEFCLNVEQHGRLKITFSPSKSHKAYAFVNGIEVVSMPTGLYYTPDGDIGASVVGQNNRYYGIDNRTALEMVQRLNIGGSFISSVEDFGMFRRWTADAAYFQESRTCMENYRAPQLATYTNLPLLVVATPKVFQTSWKSTTATHRLNNFTWKIPITSGFGYLVRLHFCDLDAEMTDGEQNEFSIFIDNQISETNADVMRWSGGTGFPVYKDYVVMIKGDEEGSQCDLFIALQSFNGLSLGFFKGMEIFRLSNLQNSLATSSSRAAFVNKVSTNWNLKVGKRFFSPFSRSNVMGTGMLVMILIVNISFFYLRMVWEESSQINVNDAAVDPSNRRFALADIRSATNNFSDASVIGRGGFGKVYRGLIYGFPDTVAIKRLSSFSRQGAREFRTEIETLSKLRHFNLVSLIGYCDEDEEMILVYEYIYGGTLAENLYKFARKGKDCTLLSWEERLRICIGAARGLEYLHTGSETAIIHRDVKDSNILLDDNLVAKISDFGLSKLEEPSQSESYISTKIKGTPGYLDPHYCSTRRLTKKSDVYSFGIVMLVVLSGRPALDSANPGETESLLACFQECLSREEFDRMVDAHIYKTISPASLREFVTSVKGCFLQIPKNRPTMAQLVASLEQALQLQHIHIGSTSEHRNFTGKEKQEDMHNQSNGGTVNLYELPDACIRCKTQKDACSLPLLAFLSSFDEVWDRFLPPDYREILSRSPVGLRLLDSSISKKELYLHLCDNSLLIDDGTKSFTLDKVSGKKRFMLSARALTIAWIDTQSYWKFISLTESRFDSVAELVSVCWLDIKGVINSKMLSPNTKYGAYLVFNVRSGFFGFQHPPQEVSMGFRGQKCKKQSVCLDLDGTRGHSTEAGRQVSWWGRRRVQQTPISRTFKQRSDGWLEIELGEIYIKGNKNADIEMRLAEVKGNNCKSGIAVEGIEIRAKQEQDEEEEEYDSIYF